MLIDMAMAAVGIVSMRITHVTGVKIIPCLSRCADKAQSQTDGDCEKKTFHGKSPGFEG